MQQQKPDHRIQWLANHLQLERKPEELN